MPRAGPSSVRSAKEIVRDTADRLAAGRTPPADWYTSPELYSIELDRVFTTAWQLVGTTSQLPTPGDYLVTAIDERREFLLIRDAIGVIRGFHNVCAHRGNRVASGCGHGGQTVMCGYHGWTYRLDGRLHAARGLETSADFDPTAFGLREVPVAVLEPFVFLLPEPTGEALSEHLGVVPDRLSSLGVEMAEVAMEAHVEVVDMILDCNWKIAVENSLECYHCPISHPGLGATFDLGRWHIAMSDRCIVQGTEIRSPDAPASGAAAAGRMGPVATAAAVAGGGIDFAVFHYLFPNNSISLWPGPGSSFNCARWIPIGPGRTRWWSMRWWPADADPIALQEQWDFMLQIGREDKAIVESLQLGVASGGWQGGVFDLRDERSGEHGVQRFNQMIVDWISPIDPGSSA